MLLFVLRDMGREKESEERVTAGKDELNLAEFPIAAIGTWPPKGVKTLVFQDEVWDRSLGRHVPRRLIVTGSDLLGLPTQVDDEVLLGCIQLTQLDGFRNRTLSLTRYELIRLLGWADEGRSYRRVAQSLDRWAGTTVISDKAWWDKEAATWVKDTFNIIDRVNLADREGLEDARAKGRQVPRLSSLRWGDFMWRSFQAGNLKDLDFEFWKSLRNATAKRLYRLLDKRFFFGPTVSFDLHRLAFEKVGLSRNMHTGQIKEKLEPANRELSERGFCRAEYVRRARGQWDVVYRRSAAADRPPLPEQGLERELVARGVARKTARALSRSRDIPTARVREKVELFDWCAAKGEAKGPGFLVRAIEDDYAVDQPVHVHDLHATILHLLDIDHRKLTVRFQRRDFRLTDVGGHVIHEILA